MPDTLFPSSLHRRLPLLLALGSSLALSFALVVGRVLITQERKFIFLLWNLFLAVIPFVLSSLLTMTKGPLRTRVLLPVGAVWLLFFPNAPYLLTDLFHLQPRPGVPYWYDLALILSCAWNGLMLGYASLTDMQTLVTRRMGFLAGWVFTTVALVLGSFGIYLGRFLRYNSWDVLSDPIALFYDILNRLVHPLSFPGTWGVTLVFGLFLLLGYSTVRLMGRAVEE